jgi:alpha-L-fucosidase 2
MKLSNGVALKTASGKNPNLFYQVEDTPDPVISTGAAVTPVTIKETMVYDLLTQAGKTYTFVAQ